MKISKLLTIVALLLSSATYAQTEVRLAVHSNFDLPKNIIAQFEQANDAKVSLVKVGSGNELANKLIISRAHPIADAVFGLDNGNIAKIRSMGVLAATQPPAQRTIVSLNGALPIDYGFITLNYDKKWFSEKGLPLPRSLDDLAKPQYKNLLAMPNPATSTPAFAFLLANIGGLGENKAFDWWGKMRQNGVKITKGWSEAYYTEFTLNGGSRPIIVGYASSPAAEVFYSKGKLKEPNMGNLFLQGGVYRQIEGAAVLTNAKEPFLASKLVQFLQSNGVQENVSTSMWVYPAVVGAKIPAIMSFAQSPKTHWSPNEQAVAQKQKDWVSRWLRVVVK